MANDDHSPLAWLDVSGELSPPAPQEISADCCDFCRWPAGRTFRLLREGKAHAVCSSCWLAFNLDTPSASQGALSWLPGLAPQDVINVQRVAIISVLAGNAGQKKNGNRVLRWLLRHKKETEGYWSTARPSELATALTRLHPQERPSLRRQLSGVHLIMPASAITDLSLLLPVGSDACDILNQCDLSTMTGGINVQIH